MFAIRFASSFVAAIVLFTSAHALAATIEWKPEQQVELVLGSGPGSGPDRSARVMQKIVQDGRMIPVPVLVVNKPVVATAYVNKFEGNGHYLLHSGQGLIANDILGRLPFSYTELTPITHTMDEYIGLAVRSDAPITSARELLDRLVTAPAAYSFGIATGLGVANHQAIAAPMHAAGIDPRKARYVIFKSGAEAITALLGGHIDAVPASLGLLLPELKNGRIRVIVVSAPQRVSGPFAKVPTWRELGVNVVLSSWRGVFGPKGLSPIQVSYWEGVFQRLMSTPEWHKEVESALATSTFMGSARTREFMERDYVLQKALLTELGLAKK